MIKKYLNLPILLQNGHQLSASPALRVRLLKRLNGNQLTISATLSGLSLLKVSPADKKYNKSNTALKIAGLLLLPGLMLSSAQAANAAKTGQRVLMIEMTPALCSLQPSRARMRQCLEGYSLTVSGLDLGYGERCGRGSEPRLTPLQLKVVNRIMPDTTVRTQAWQHYGACSPLSASSYFRQIVNHAGALKLPNELNTGNTYTVSKLRFISQMTRLNSGMTSASIDLICQAGSRRQTMLTDVHVCYEGSQFGTCNKVVDNCGTNFIISGGK
ncbi:ribonuclease T2 [Psychrobacter sp. PL15]|jgi:ribonuclease T2|uniref:ribonuclease T2 n=1 Tax=unclassified Psychrobacter TaxID=196806 RepID=UPI002DFF06E7|nr:ribonuclease T2 [Psychrobacter sp. PL15]